MRLLFPSIRCFLYFGGHKPRNPRGKKQAASGGKPLSFLIRYFDTIPWLDVIWHWLVYSRAVLPRGIQCPFLLEIFKKTDGVAMIPNTSECMFGEVTYLSRLRVASMELPMPVGSAMEGRILIWGSEFKLRFNPRFSLSWWPKQDIWKRSSFLNLQANIRRRSIDLFLVQGLSSDDVDRRPVTMANEGFLNSLEPGQSKKNTWAMEDAGADVDLYAEPPQWWCVSKPHRPSCWYS